MIRSTLILLITLAAALCPKASAQQTKPENPPSQSAATNKDTNLVIARISGRPITENQLLWVIERLAVQKRLAVDQRENRNSLFFKEGLENCIMLAALRNQAERENIVIDKTTLDQQLQEYMKNYSSEDEFRKTLERQGITETELRDRMEESLIVRKMLDQAVKDAPTATDEEISKFYSENQERFPVQEQVRASHILIKADLKSTPEQKAEDKKRLESIRADIEAHKITFSDAAVKYSQDFSNAQEGGDLGFFTRGKMVKPFEDVAFAMRSGEISPVVETQHGYHLIQVTELKPARTATLEEAKGTITSVLNREAQLKVRQKYVDDLMARITIETYMTQEEFVKRHSVK